MIDLVCKDHFGVTRKVQTAIHGRYEFGSPLKGVRTAGEVAGTAGEVPGS